LDKIIFFCPYPLHEAASQRFRFAQYIKTLEQEVIILPFLSEKAWNIYHQKGNVFLKFSYISISFFKRFFQLFSTLNAKYVFIHREAAPIGPPIFEFIIAKIFRKKIVYDFDDAIWLENFNENNRSFQKLKCYSKVNKIINWSYKISAGNEYLAEYARKYNPNVVINPTTIDTENYHNPDLYKVEKFDKVTIGWTGTATTNKYLEFLIPVMEKLSSKHNFYFNVISDVNPNLEIKNFKFTKWNKETEIENLLRFDIGVMPLTDDIWAKGKCGFKALQYMALEIPAIVSPVGVNEQIVDHEINGFIATTEQEWYNCLDRFLSNKENYNQMGIDAREKIIDYFSVKSNKNNFINLFKD
jgi:glycosyltransferase involved in cell wall biosynthesis